jgi:redox-sensing transcriptional repressor
MGLPDRTIERLVAYRRQLDRLLDSGQSRIYSHELAAAHKVTPAQVRRDVMLIGYTGSPARGYEAAGLRDRIAEILDPPEDEGVVLVGIGHLGRALLAYFTGRHPQSTVVAAFDVDPELTDQVIHGCRCHPLDQLETVIAGQRIGAAIIAVPGQDAQDVANRLIRSGVKAILNFAPVQLHVPGDVFVESIDIAVSLEKTAYFARAKAQQRKAQ